MKIKFAQNKDLKDYLNLKNESLKEYSILAKEKIELKEKEIKKEFLELLKNKNSIFLLAKEDKNCGFIISTITKNAFSKINYIDDLFVLKEYRKKGIGTKLIKELINYSKKKKIKKLRLGVRPNNKKAIALYNKLGFEIKHYEMDLKIKMNPN